MLNLLYGSVAFNEIENTYGECVKETTQLKSRRHPRATDTCLKKLPSDLRQYLNVTLCPKVCLMCPLNVRLNQYIMLILACSRRVLETMGYHLAGKP